MKKGICRRVHPEKLRKLLRRLDYPETQDGFRAILKDIKEHYGGTIGDKTFYKVFGKDPQPVSEDVQEFLVEGLRLLLARQLNLPAVLDDPRLKIDIFDDAAGPEDKFQELATRKEMLESFYWASPAEHRLAAQSIYPMACLIEELFRTSFSPKPEKYLALAQACGAWLDACPILRPGPRAWSKRPGIYFDGLEGVAKAKRYYYREAGLAHAGLEHAAPFTNEGVLDVGYLTWGNPNGLYPAGPVGASLRKSSGALTLFHGPVANGENESTVTQRLISARLNYQDPENGLAAAEAELSFIKGVLKFGSWSNEAYFHVVSHHFLWRKGQKDAAREELRTARNCYVAKLGEDHLQVAACDVLLAERYPDEPNGGKLADAVQRILATPLGCLGTLDLTPVRTGTSPIYKRIKYDAPAYRKWRWWRTTGLGREVEPD